eukprot:scaffold16628_cov78-Phaeocystis_antarctica.AAC.5
MTCTELRPSDARGMLDSTGEPFSSARIRVAVETVSCEGACLGGCCKTGGVPSWGKESESVPAPAPKKRRSAAAIALSSSGITCPPLCHSIVMLSQREGTLKSCAALNSSSALPSTCNDGTELPLPAAKIGEELERRRARRHCCRDECTVGDAADAADRRVLPLDPAFDVSHALTYYSGAARLVFCRKLPPRFNLPHALIVSCISVACLLLCCQPPPKVAGLAVLPRCSEALIQSGQWTHCVRRRTSTAVMDVHPRATGQLYQPPSSPNHPVIPTTHHVTTIKPAPLATALPTPRSPHNTPPTVDTAPNHSPFVSPVSSQRKALHHLCV